MTVQAIWFLQVPITTIVKSNKRIMEKQEASKRSQILCIIQVIVEYLANIMLMDSFLAIITKELGISTAGTGMLTSIKSATSFFVLGALVFRKKRIKKYVLMTYCVGFIMLLVYYIVPVTHIETNYAQLLLVVITFVANVLINVVSSRRTAWFIALNDARNRAKVMAVKSAGSLGAAIVLKNALAYVYQIYLEKNEIDKYFICCAIVMGILVLINILCICFIEEPSYVELAEEEPRRLIAFEELLKNRKIWTIFRVTFIVAICDALVTPFLGSYKMTDLGFSLSYDAMIVSITSVIGGVFSFLWGIYADRRNCTYAYRKCMTVMALAYAVNIFVVPDNGKTTYLIFALIQSIASAGNTVTYSNMLFENIGIKDYSDVTVISGVLGSVISFVTTSFASVVVSWIQGNGNMILGMEIYPLQLLSAVTCVFYILLIFCIKKLPKHYMF